MNVNWSSRQFIGSAPNESKAYMNVDWYQTNQTYFGVESSQCRGHVGMPVGGKRVPLDAYGNILGTAALTGDGHRKKHDTNKWNFDYWLGYANIYHDIEPYGTFAACCSQADAYNAQTRNQKQGLVPDMLVNWGPVDPEEFDEHKGINFSKAYYNPQTVLTRCGGVEKRAVTVPSEYDRTTKKADIKYNDWDPANPVPGPIRTRYRSYGPPRALVIGMRGESSKDVDRFVRKTAEIGGERKWRRMGARSAREATAAIMHSMRRSIGIVATRVNAIFLRERLGVVLGNSPAASKRRKQAKYQERKMRHNYAHWARWRF